MRTPLLALTLAALLSACAIPYETPEARANIERDLKLSADEIVTITETNWCLSPYGDLQVCRPKHGLGVLTKSKLVLAFYKGGIYQQAEVINASDVQCAQIPSTYSMNVGSPCWRQLPWEVPWPSTRKHSS